VNCVGKETSSRLFHAWEKLACIAVELLFYFRHDCLANAKPMNALHDTVQDHKQRMKTLLLSIGNSNWLQLPSHQHDEAIEDDDDRNDAAVVEAER